MLFTKICLFQAIKRSQGSITSVFRTGSCYEQGKTRRGKRDVIVNQIHSISNRIYAGIESAQDKYTFGFQTESDCKRLGNSLLICDWLHATKLNNCWSSILNGKEKVVLQSCKSTSSMTKKSCFVK